MSEKVKQTIRITHTVEYVIEASPDPGVPKSFIGNGFPARTAEQVIERVLEALRLDKNPTRLSGQYGGYYSMKQIGDDGRRVTIIEVLP